MDFFELYDARSAADQPIELPLRDQATGEVIKMGGKPCIVLVKGMDARSVTPEVRAALLEGIDDMTMRDRLHIVTMKAAKPYIAGFKNMLKKGEDGKPVPMSLDDVDAFLDLNMASVSHSAWRAPAKLDGETDEAYKARVDADRGVWRGASFAQQIVDASRAEHRALGKLPGA